MVGGGAREGEGCTGRTSGDGAGSGSTCLFDVQGETPRTQQSVNRRFGGKSDPATGLPGMNVCGESVKVVAR